MALRVKGVVVDTDAFEITCRDSHGTRFIALTGELDLPNFASLLTPLEGWEAFDRVVVDTTDLRFLDSSGLSTLIAARRTMGPERFRLIPGTATLRLLKLTSTEDLLGTDGDPTGPAAP
jgi:anti-anti-sigma factor